MKTKCTKTANELKLTTSDSDSFITKKFIKTKNGEIILIVNSSFDEEIEISLSEFEAIALTLFLNE